ncbi:MAG: T9SS type A sorting domain-containing protein [Prolixibacteraceae bacterium]
MKTRLFAFLLILLPVGLTAQTSLTFLNNSLRINDSNTYQEIQFPDPGTSGPNQEWDFSHIQLTDKSQCSSVQFPTLQRLSGLAAFNLVLAENGYQYFLNSSSTSLEEAGYINNDLKLSLVYIDPVLKMKYPFAYGNQYTDHFEGVAIFDGTSKIDLAGDFTVSADAYGTLILPDRVIKDILRVKSVKNGQQNNVCGTTDFNIVRYSWYADGYRYPLLNLNVVETRSNGVPPVVTKTANYNIQQLYEKKGVLATVAQSSPTALPASEVEVVISPNPFKDQLTYSYVLPESMDVSIDLYEMSGKTIGWIFKNQSQGPGLHNDELFASKFGLGAGVYFMRFTFDKQVVIKRIVRL